MKLYLTSDLKTCHFNEVNYFKILITLAKGKTGFYEQFGSA